MKIAGAAVLVTGANRGLGRALAEETLRRGAKRVYAGTRKLFAHSDARYTFCVGGDQNGSSRQQVTEFVPDKKVVWHV